MVYITENVVAGTGRNGRSLEEGSCECEEANRHGKSRAKASRTKLPEEGEKIFFLILDNPCFDPKPEETD